MSDDKKARLQKYAEEIKQRMNTSVPTKHSTSPAKAAAYKQMLEIDLRKTQAKMEKL